MSRGHRAAQLVDHALQRRKIDRCLARFLGHAETAAEVDDACLSEARGKTTEQLPHFLPVADVEHAAAGVRMQPDDARPECRDPALQFLELEQRHTELRVHTCGAHVVVVSAAVARVDANQQLAAAEQLAPVAQRVQVVERDPGASLERPGVLLAGREVRA